MVIPPIKADPETQGHRPGAGKTTRLQYIVGFVILATPIVMMIYHAITITAKCGP